MKTTIEIINELTGMRVLDIGGIGYGGSQAKRDCMLHKAWERTKRRTTLDIKQSADILLDLEAETLPFMPWNHYDVTCCFGVLEHLLDPAKVLRWIGTERIVVMLPTGTSFLHEWIEMDLFLNNPDFKAHGHCYSFVPRTAH